ncbi:MAG: zf-TFIIB domain-containing protein [Elusimicrobia bacterium]|jgi:Zn-finger nucleic acid-binding protein|nr:zf-TFIIB domain-containing protein [Elusimicrobiota bacterium]
MICPVCNKKLKTINYENQEVDLCLKCGGIWFDKGELLKVVNGLLSKNKIAPQTVKETYRNKLIRIDKIKKLQRKCPRCNVVMNLKNYSYDSNIIIDKCPSCSGIWTDEGEMQAVAKYIKGNPDMDNYTKALVGACAEGQKSGSNKGKIITAIISLFYLGFASFFNGSEGFLIMLLFLILPLGCIFFGDELGGVTGVRFRTTFFAPVVTKPTPGAFVVFIGWVLLLFPIIFGILSAIGIFN